jgi:alpha-tubulin suppressor-like RCC1 family protein
MPNFSGVWNLKEQIQAIAAGRWTGIATGELYAWGQGTSGQIGDGTVVSKSSPVQVDSSTNWDQVSAGSAFMLAVKTDGTLWSWGAGSLGRLGHNNEIELSSPVQVGALTTWYQVSAGLQHSTAVKTDGTLWSWGEGDEGRLGNGDATVNFSSPVQVGALTNWSQVSAGNAHSSAVKTDGTAWTWGKGDNGQLGQNDTVRYSSPVQVGALTAWAQISSGNTQTAAVKTDGTLWTWGNGYIGRLGHNDIVSLSSPVQVGALTTWAQVSTGAASAHMAAVKTDGTLWTWGRNNNGRLATTLPSTNPALFRLAL